MSSWPIWKQLDVNFRTDFAASDEWKSHWCLNVRLWWCCRMQCWWPCCCCCCQESFSTGPGGQHPCQFEPGSTDLHVGKGQNFCGRASKVVRRPSFRKLGHCLSFEPPLPTHVKETWVPGSQGTSTGGKGRGERERGRGHQVALEPNFVLALGLFAFCRSTLPATSRRRWTGKCGSAPKSGFTV